MSSAPFDAQPSFWRRAAETSVETDAVADAAGIILNLREEGQAFELPGRLFEQLPFAVYVCDRDGLVLRYNHRAAELWGRAPKLGDPNERFCGSYRMFRPDGSLLRIINVPWPMCYAPAFPFASKRSTLSGRTACAALR